MKYQWIVNDSWKVSTRFPQKHQQMFSRYYYVYQCSNYHDIIFAQMYFRVTCPHIVPVFFLSITKYNVRHEILLLPSNIQPSATHFQLIPIQFIHSPHLQDAMQDASCGHFLPVHPPSHIVTTPLVHNTIQHYTHHHQYAH